MGRSPDDGDVFGYDFRISGHGVCGYPVRPEGMDSHFCTAVFCAAYGNLRNPY